MNLCGVHLVFAGVQLVDDRDSFHREPGRKSSSCVETSGHCRGRWEGGRGGRWEGEVRGESGRREMGGERREWEVGGGGERREWEEGDRR